MKKLSALFVTLAAVMTLSACSWELPKCYDELDECGRDGAFTEERTARAGKKPMTKPRPEPVIQAPQPMPEPAPEPVVEPAPAPEPVVVDDSAMMQSAEPQFKQISK